MFLTALQTAMEWIVKFYNMHKQSVEIPLIFFSLAFFIILIGLFSKLSFKGQQTVPGIYQNVTPIVTPVIENNKVVKSLDYNKPITCDFSNKESTVSAKVDGTKIAVTLSEATDKQHIVVNGDCMYKWAEKEKNNGQKKCGIGTFVLLGKQLLSSGLSNTQVVESITKQAGKTPQFDTNSLLKTCSNTTNINTSFFVIPKDVQFK